MMCVVSFLKKKIVLPSHSSRVLSGDGLVDGNPTMDSPRLRRGGGIASSSSLVLLVLVLLYIFCL